MKTAPAASIVLAEEGMTGLAPPHQPRGFGQVRKGQRAVIALGVLLALGVALRLYNLTTVPARNETADEYGWTWAGMSLVQHGEPRSWSLLFSYPTAEVIEWRGAKYRLVEPYLDNPPLFPLLVGGWMTVLGERDPLAVSLARMRSVTVALFAVTFILLALVLRRLGGDRLMWLGLLFFTLASPAVINGRLVVSENLYSALFLGGYLILLREREGPGAFIGLAVLAALLPLSKIPAITLDAALCVVALMRKQRRLALAVVVGTLVGVLAVAAYAAHYSWPLFIGVLQTQRLRFQGFGGLFELLFVHKLLAVPFFYPPFFLAVMALLTGRVKRFEVALMLAIYAASMTVLVGQKDVYGWYLIPMYPLLCIGLAEFVIGLLDDWQGIGVATYALLTITYLLLVVSSREGHWLTLSRLGYVTALLGALAAIAWVRHREGRGQRLLVACLVAMQACADLFYVLR